MRVLLTGASGFVGRHLARALVERGWAVRAAVRASPAPGLLAPEVEPVVTGDLREPVDWRAALEGVEAVVHAAGLAHARSNLPEEEYRQVNGDATRHLARSAEGRIGRFVFLSSIRAQCGPVAAGRLSERDAPRPSDAYGRSKLSAEQGLAASGLAWIALRPVVVYGEGVGGNMGALARLARTPLPLPFAGLTSPRSVLSVENLAEAVGFVLTMPADVSGPLIVTDPDVTSLAGILGAMREAMDRPPRLFAPPAGALAAGLTLLGRREAWTRLEGGLAADPARLLSLGWRPPVGSTGEGLRRWLRATAREPA